MVDARSTLNANDTLTLMDGRENRAQNWNVAPLFIRYDDDVIVICFD
jgi:hypothetical protein